MADVDEGVLVQMVQGLHSGVNPVSGDFSTGASGLMIRNGQLAEPVREFTIASTLQKMLKDVVEVGGDVEWLPMTQRGVPRPGRHHERGLSGPCRPRLRRPSSGIPTWRSR